MSNELILAKAIQQLQEVVSELIHNKPAKGRHIENLLSEKLNIGELVSKLESPYGQS